MSETNLARHVAENREEHVELVRLWGAQTAALSAAVLEILTVLIDAKVLTPRMAAETAEQIMARLRYRSGLAREEKEGPDPEALWQIGDQIGDLALPLSTHGS